MKYKVGDKVRIVDNRTGHWNFVEQMGKWLGRVMTIDGMSGSYYLMAEDHGECPDQEHGGWHWYEDMIAGPATYEIHITCNDGKTTNAVCKEAGKITKRSKATLHDGRRLFHWHHRCSCIPQLTQITNG